MKARTVRLDAAASPADAVQILITVRLAEMLAAAPALEKDDNEAIHRFRLSCKRLRFAVDRFSAWVPRASEIAETLREISDVTGETHDAALLVKYAERCGARELARSETRRRRSCLDRARRAWRAAFESGAMQELNSYAGFTESRL